MTPEEQEQLRQWIAYGLSDEMIGANWHQNCRNHGHLPPAESPRQTGERLRLELRSLSDAAKRSAASRKSGV